MANRIHLYPPRDDDREIRACYITSEVDYGESVDFYGMKLGVSDKYGVDYHATYDGSKAKINKNVPYLLYGAAPIRVRESQSVCVDITTSGLPPSLSGTSIHLVMGDVASDPAQRVQNQEIRAAVDGVTDWVLGIHGDEDVVTVVLPDIPNANRANQYDHDEDDSVLEVTGSAFVAGSVSVSASGSTARPLSCLVSAHVSFYGSDPSSGIDILDIAISDGSTSTPIHTGSVNAVAEYDNVSTSRAVLVNTLTTFTLQLRAGSGAPQVCSQSISLIAMEQ